MPTLLIINVTCNQGSTGKISEQVGLMMQQRGWNVYYAHGARRVNPSQLKTIPFSSIRGEYLHALKSLLFDANGLGSTRATQKLVEQIKEIHPDIIQIHNIHGYYLNYKILFEYLNSTDIPIILTMHDCWNFTGHCTHFVTAMCKKWKTGCYDCPLLNVSPKSYIDRSKRNYALKKSLLTSNKNLHIVPVSYWLESMVRESFLKGKDIQVIQNGVDLNIFKPYPKKRGTEFKILGVANVWNKDKGIYDIYKLREMLSLSGFQITLVGLTQNQIANLPEGIVGITATANQKDLAELYSGADVLINPTYADTFPTINLEALACGIPVVTYRTGGSPESLDSKTGIVVEQGNVTALANSFMYLRENPLSSEDCRKRAEEYFDKNRCFEKYVNKYESLLV